MAPQRPWRIFGRGQAQGHLWESIRASRLPLTSRLMSHSSSLTFPLPPLPFPLPNCSQTISNHILCVIFTATFVKSLNHCDTDNISAPFAFSDPTEVSKTKPPPLQCKHLPCSTTLVYAAVGQTLKGKWDHRGYWPPLRCKINLNLC